MKSSGKIKKPIAKGLSQTSLQKKAVLPPPPPKLSEETENLFSTQDFTELEYRRIDLLRQHAKQTPETIKQIVEHGKIERRIAEAPQRLLQEAYEAIDHGTSLLLKLVRSKKLLNVLMPTEKGKANGVAPHSSDHSFACMASRIEYSNRQLVRLAEIGVPNARHTLFFEAKALTEAFIRLAQAFPDDFRNAAESSLTMPSLRARTPAFSADAQTIAERIHLAEKHPAASVADNRERLGALCHTLVARLVEAIARERSSYKSDLERYEMLRNFRETAEEYRNISFDEWLRSHYYPTTLEGLIASSKLPDLKDNPNAWWTARILPMVKEEFAKISKQPIRNAALWEELEEKTPKYTHAAMRRLMEKNCRNKLFRIAKTCP